VSTLLVLATYSSFSYSAFIPNSVLKPMAVSACKSKLKKYIGESSQAVPLCGCAWKKVNNTSKEKTHLIDVILFGVKNRWKAEERHQVMSCIQSHHDSYLIIKAEKKHPTLVKVAE
jgi:hypothetical protein